MCVKVRHWCGDFLNSYGTESLTEPTAFLLKSAPGPVRPWDLSVSTPPPVLRLQSQSRNTIPCSHVAHTSARSTLPNESLPSPAGKVRQTPLTFYCTYVRALSLTVWTPTSPAPWMSHAVSLGSPEKNHQGTCFNALSKRKTKLQNSAQQDKYGIIKCNFMCQQTLR